MKTSKTVQELMDLTECVAVVTGGYGHLGKSMTLALAEAGARVYVADLNEKVFSRIFGPKRHPGIHFVPIDISHTSEIRKAFKFVYRKTGRFDILINNAFYGASNMPDNMTDKEWNKGIDGCLSSVFRCIREVFPYMKKRKSGSIINIASMYGVVSPDFSIYQDFPGFLNPPNYGTSKAGIIQLTRYFAMYGAPYHIRVNAIAPGAFPSPLVQKKKKFIQSLKRKIPMGRIGRPDELKGAVVLLASQASSYITGQTLLVDGGWTIY